MSHRPHPTQKADLALASLLFLLSFLSYLYFSHGGSWGSNAFLDLTRAMVEEKTFRIDTYVWNTGDWARVGEHHYINKNPGPSFLAVPVYALYHSLRSDCFSNFVDARLAIHVITALSFSLLAALATPLFFLWLRRFAAPLPALASTLVLALGCSQWTNASFFNAGIVVSSSYIIATYLIFRAGDEDLPAWRVRAWEGFAGFCLAFAVLAEPLSLAGVLIFAGLLLVMRKSRRTWLNMVLGGLLPALILGAYNQAILGVPWGSLYEYQNPVFSQEGAFFGIFRAPSLDVLYRITVHPIRGLFWVTPVFLLSVPGLLALGKRRNTRAPALLCLAIISLYLLFNVSFVAWHGGWYVGPRYLSPALPFFAAALVPVFSRPGTLRSVAVFLAGLSVTVQLAVVSVNPFPPRLPKITNPLRQYIWPNLRAGLLSINNASAFPRSPRPASRFFSLDSFEEWWAAYNLGELGGLSGLASLGPLLMAWTLIGVLMWRVIKKG